MIGFRQLSQFAMRNKSLVDISTRVGCYYCCKIYSASEIREYTDDGKTCICPYCNIDAVVPDSSGYVLTEVNLKVAHDYWF